MAQLQCPNGHFYEQSTHSTCPYCPAPGNSTLTVTDNRTGKTYNLPLYDGNIRALDLRQVKVHPDDFGMISYDPAYVNTAACKSSITFIDGDQGILRYRGYPIEDLAEKCNFLEVAYLLLFGDLPTEAELEEWEYKIQHHTMLHENAKKFMDGFHHNAHPMGMLVSTVAALSTFYPKARHVTDPDERMLNVLRLIAKMPTIAAYVYRHSLGFPYVYPDNSLSYTQNFMNMLWQMTEPNYVVNPSLARALDVLFILHADHEQNCSTTVMRCVGSTQADPFLTLAAAAAALAGPLHGGANEELIKMLDEIGSVDRVPAYIRRVKAGELRLMGFGHRVYKSYDPRASIIKKAADPGIRCNRQQPTARYCARARADCAPGRLLHPTELVSTRGFLLGDHVPSSRVRTGVVYCAIRHPAHGWMAGAVARDTGGFRAEDRPAASSLYWRRTA
jgi:citrate synthase